jgi:hypothetical protein
MMVRQRNLSAANVLVSAITTKPDANHFRAIGSYHQTHVRNTLKKIFLATHTQTFAEIKTDYLWKSVHLCLLLQLARGSGKR